MSKEQYKPDDRLRNVAATEDTSSSKNEEKLIEVKKNDTAGDKDKEFKIHEKPSDEQMYQSFDDLRKEHMDEEGD